MGIRQRGNSYLVDVTIGGVRRTGTAPDRNKAELLQAELRAELLRTVGAQVEHKQTWTLQQALEKTDAISWQDKASGVQLRRNAEQVVEILGPATPLTSISTESVDELVEALQERGDANGTINRKLAALSRMLTVAQQRGKLDRLPHLQRRDEAECRIRFLSLEEEQLMVGLLRQWGKEDQADAVVVLIDTGLRPSELWRVEARDFDAQVVNIWKTKNKHARSIPMTRRVRDILLRRAAVIPQGRLFPFTNWWLGDAWDRAKAHLKLAKDTQFIPYALRHTCLSRLVQRGVPLKVVQEWAGHQIITTTMRYAHLCPTNLLDAVRVLNGNEQGRAYAPAAESCPP